MHSFSRKPRSARRRRLVGAAFSAAVLAAVLTVMPAHGTWATASLEEEKSEVDQRVDELMAEFEDLDEELARVVAELEEANAAMPSAEDELEKAEQELADAEKEEEELEARLTSAETAQETLGAQIEDGEKAIEEGQGAVTSIARQAYKNSGVTSDVALLLQMANAEDGAMGLGRVDSAVRSQQRSLTQLSEQKAINENNEDRLAAVAGEVEDLRAEAAQVVLTKEAAQEAAQEKKDALDELVAQKDEASRTIEEHKTQAQLELEEQQQEQQRLLDEIAAWEEEHGQDLPDVGQGAGSDGDGQLSNPASGYPITSDFGYRIHPISGNRKLHTGTDFGVPCGTPMHAAGDGTVVSAGWSGGYGYRVVIAHGTINGSSIQTTYNHNTSLDVSAGQTVRQGDVVAHSGTTGSSTGCHLHFEVIQDGEYVDPMPWIS
ncbi:peptidoglycan DD-metalloendopeptidase family protein [Brevibacterium samyangense]|uniref:M23 family metallopeptidase n=1 Tax=Brevibacterium samyangense TaxID=366888 RepID=A0ABN2T852_9MICO